MSSLDAEMTWLESVLHDSFESYFGELSPELKTPPQLGHLQDSFAQLINEHNLNIYERLMLALELAPHVKPQLLELFFTNSQLVNILSQIFSIITTNSHQCQRNIIST